VEVIGTAISAIIAAGGTLLVVTAVVLIGGIVVVARRRTRPAQVEAGIRRRAGSALVRADDRLAEGEADVEFAVAQFGERAAQEYRGALRRAQTDRDEIFRLHRMIDDDPGAGLANRERADRIVMLADRIARLLDEQAGAFRQRRSLESTAPERLERLRSRIAEARGRLATATTQRDALLEQHARTALGPAVDAPERAARALDRAEGQAADAAPGSTAPASSVMATIAEAERLLFSAEEALEQIEATAARLADAVTALDALRADARAARTEALAAVDAAPDGDTGAAITAAVSELDAALAATSADVGSPADSPTDPLEQLDELRQAMDAVELALASSRTQAQRLTHAREAYHAARVQAEAQVLAARDAIGQRGSAGARARLEEAVDELRASRAMLDTDPVGALDAVRRALTHARDAEVLARY
jgi:chromosome segregation ATPase